MSAIRARLIKARMLDYLRYKRNRASFTEFQERFNPPTDCEDIVCINKELDEVWCIEVKVSKQDFINDFKHKRKWENLENNFFHKMFFVVPCELEDFVLKHLENYPQVGLFLWVENGYIMSRKRAKLLKPKEKLSDKLLGKMLLRMGSEIANLSMREIDYE